MESQGADTAENECPSIYSGKAELRVAVRVLTLCMYISTHIFFLPQRCKIVNFFIEFGAVAVPTAMSWHDLSSYSMHGRHLLGDLCPYINGFA